MEQRLSLQTILFSKWILFLELLFLIEPEGFKYYSRTSSIFSMAQSLIVLLVLVQTIVYYHHRNISLKNEAFVGWIFLYYGCMLVATVFGEGIILVWLSDNRVSLALCLVVWYGMHLEPKRFLNILSFSEIYIYINLASILFIPNGMIRTSNGSAYWFLGYRNVQIRFILPVLAFSLIRSYYVYKRITLRTMLALLTGCFTLLILNTATGRVGLLVFLAFLFLYHRRRLPDIFSMKWVLAGFGALFLGLVYFNVQQYFSEFIEKTLSRDVTLTGRTYIWKLAIGYIGEHFLLGLGYIESADYVRLFGRAGFTHPHNYILYQLMMGGIVLLAILIWGYILVGRKIREHRKSPYAKIIMFGIIAFMLMGMTESLVTTDLLYPLLTMGASIDTLVMSEQDVKTKPRKFRIKFRH